jgi:hypothetical protein
MNRSFLQMQPVRSQALDVDRQTEGDAGGFRKGKGIQIFFQFSAQLCSAGT